MYLFFIRWFVYLFSRISHRAKCPACGCTSRHTYKFAPGYGHIIHNCSDCGAVWADKPLVDYKDWKVELPAIVNEDPLEAARDPNRGIKIVPTGHKAPEVETTESRTVV